MVNTSSKNEDVRVTIMHWKRTAFIDLINRAQRSVRILLRERIDDLIIEKLGLLLHDDVSVTIVIDGALIQEGKDSPFFVYKLLELSKSGAFIYTQDENQSTSSKGQFSMLLQIDHEASFQLDETTSKRFDVETSSYWRTYFDHYEEKSTEYTPAISDLDIQIDLSFKTIDNQRYTQIHWEVGGAQEVFLEGEGLVKSEGSIEQLITATRLINITAVNASSRKVKTIRLEAAQKPVIHFDLQFLNPNSGKYVSLPEAETGHVFGVNRGFRIRLSWRVEHADRVLIEPIQSTQFEGVYEVTAEEPLEFVLKAEANELFTEEVIQIQVFPVSIFHAAKIEIEQEWLEEHVVQLRDHLGEVEHFVSEKRLELERSQEQLMRSLNNSNEDLKERLRALNFGTFYQSYGIHELNNVIGKRIRDYFRNQPEVIDLINTMKNYYGRR